jgi:hypothetical protein
MRTEHDLTQALAALEQYAPDPDQVLRAVRGGPRRAGRPRQRRLILPVAAAAAAALGLAVALLPGSGSPHPAPSALPAAASVAKAMLTAFDSAAGDIEYETVTGISHGATVDVYRGWSWPAQQVAGQRAIIRTLYSQATPPSSVVRPVEDREIDFVTPPANASAASDQVTMVCFRGSSQPGCGFGEAETPAGTWSRFTSQNRYGTDVGPGATFNPARLIQGIASGAWRVVGHTILDGRPAIQLSGNSDAGFLPMPVTLWVDAQTYLPIRLVSGAAAADTGMDVMDFTFLPPTAANLALLQVPIPPGYPQAAPRS